MLYLFTCRSDEPVYYDESIEIRRGSNNYLVLMGPELTEVIRKFYVGEDSTITQTMNRSSVKKLNVYVD